MLEKKLFFWIQRQKEESFLILENINTSVFSYLICFHISWPIAVIKEKETKKKYCVTKPKKTSFNSQVSRLSMSINKQMCAKIYRAAGSFQPLGGAKFFSQ